MQYPAAHSRDACRTRPSSSRMEGLDLRIIRCSACLWRHLTAVERILELKSMI